MQYFSVCTLVNVNYSTETDTQRNFLCSQKCKAQSIPWMQLTFPKKWIPFLRQLEVYCILNDHLIFQRSHSGIAMYAVIETEWPCTRDYLLCGHQQLHWKLGSECWPYCTTVRITLQPCFVFAKCVSGLSFQWHWHWKLTILYCNV